MLWNLMCKCLLAFHKFYSIAGPARGPYPWTGAASPWTLSLPSGFPMEADFSFSLRESSPPLSVLTPCPEERKGTIWLLKIIFKYFYYLVINSLRKWQTSPPHFSHSGTGPKVPYKSWSMWLTVKRTTTTTTKASTTLYQPGHRPS